MALRKDINLIEKENIAFKSFFENLAISASLVKLKIKDIFSNEFTEEGIKFDEEAKKRHANEIYKICFNSLKYEQQLISSSNMLVQDSKFANEIKMIRSLLSPDLKQQQEREQMIKDKKSIYYVKSLK